MEFDINQVLQNMINSAHDVISDGTGEIGSYVSDIINNQKTSLEDLSIALLNGEITKGEFEEEILREKKVVEAEFLAVKVMSKAMAEKVVNSAMDSLRNAVFALL